MFVWDRASGASGPQRAALATSRAGREEAAGMTTCFTIMIILLTTKQGPRYWEYMQHISNEPNHLHTNKRVLYQ